MARESDAGARAKQRRGSLSLDPNRSSMRRVSSRRSAVPRGSTAPTGTPSVVPTSVARAEFPGVPRNRRLPRALKKERTGPRLTIRAWRALFDSFASFARGSSGLVCSLATRMRGPTSWLARGIGVCAVLLGAVGLGRFVQRHLTTAPAFAIDAIEVKGSTRLERAELLEAAGIELGANVFARSPEEVRARLLHHPWILGANVERKLPSRFEITVREREPVALLVVEACATTPGRARDESRDDASCDEGSSLYLVSDDARMFKRLSRNDPVDLPVITGVTRQRVASDPELSRRVLDQSIALMHEYAKSGLAERDPIGEIHVEDNDGVSLYVGADLTYVRLGAAPFEQKLRRMKKVFERLSAESARAEYVYLDNEQRPDRVAVRLR